MAKNPKNHWRVFEKDEDGFDRQSRMKPRTKKSSKAAQLDQAFELPEEQWLERHPDSFAARVVEVHKRYAFVSPEPTVGQIQTRDVWLATIARKFLQAKQGERNFIVVGDRVACTPTSTSDAGVVTDLPQCVMQQLSPRRSLIKRIDPMRSDLEHVLASNVDQLLIVASYVGPTVKWGLIDRYLVLAELQGIRPIIVLNKKDLLRAEDQAFQDEVKHHEKVYKDLGYLVYSLQANSESARKSPDVTELRFELKGRISMLSGHSGVGKSSLVNLFQPELVQAVEKNDDIFYKGRHTTSYASFLKLGTGGYVIDTPGIRSFVLQDLNHRELSEGFIEFRNFTGQCKYRECRHLEEPECAVRAAAASGAIDARRYQSYKGILQGTTGREGRTREMGDQT
jgi:ribosome biogenesis GTPase / thiamine phosphate phosphatase